jgi:hypothetical protein
LWRVYETVVCQRDFAPRLRGTNRPQTTMSKQPLVASSVVDDESGNGGRDVQVISIADQRRTRRLRNGLILANAVAWIVILAALKWAFFS